MGVGGRVAVGMLVAVGDGVGVEVGVSTIAGVGVEVGSDVNVGLGEGEEVEVGVGVGAAVICRESCSAPLGFSTLIWGESGSVSGAGKLSAL